MMLNKTPVKVLSVNKSKTTNPSFHQSIGPLLAYGQFFGMLPVDGVLAKDESQVEFRWKSVKTIYSMVFLLLGTIESCLGSRRLLRLGFKINFAEGLLFFISAMVRAYIIFFLARKWKVVIKRWRETEDVFLRHPYRVKGWSLSARVRVIFAVLAALSLVEHVFFLVAAISDNQLQIEYCTPKSQIFWDNFLARYRPHLRYHFPYSPFELPIYEWVNLLQSFAWNYGDMFIIMLATGISFRFNQLNDYFRFVLKDESLMTPSTWRDFRICYFKLIDFVYFIDKKVSTLVLISLGHNMLILMLKIFNAFKPNRYNKVNDGYFWFYIIFLILRTICLLSSSAAINEVSKKPLIYIRNVPTKLWTIDLKRLFDMIEVESPTLAFSGKQFFYITRGLILGMAGTIVTFEILLLDEVDATKEDLCTVIDY